MHWNLNRNQGELLCGVLSHKCESVIVIIIMIMIMIIIIIIIIIIRFFLLIIHCANRRATIYIAIKYE